MEEQFGHIASLIGDPVRAKILWALLDGKAYTATELSMYANTSPQNASMHLSKLLQSDLLSAESQGRHRYYKFARQEVAYAIEALANLIPGDKHKSSVTTDKQSAIKYCRTCYDHLAGKVGVLITDSLLQQKLLIDRDDLFEVSAKGVKWLAGIGINTSELKQQRRSLARPCLDWSERRHHLAGSLGASLLNKMLASDWLRKTKASRAIIITAKGQKALFDYFKINV